MYAQKKGVLRLSLLWDGTSNNCIEHREYWGLPSQMGIGLKAWGLCKCPRTRDVLNKHTIPTWVSVFRVPAKRLAGWFEQESTEKPPFKWARVRRIFREPTRVGPSWAEVKHEHELERQLSRPADQDSEPSKSLRLHRYCMPFCAVLSSGAAKENQFASIPSVGNSKCRKDEPSGTS